jgi:hypothetical protein
MDSFDWTTYYALKNGKGVPPAKMLDFLEKARSDAFSFDYREDLVRQYSELYAKWLALDPEEIKQKRKQVEDERRKRDAIILEWKMRNDNKPNTGQY